MHDFAVINRCHVCYLFGNVQKPVTPLLAHNRREGKMNENEKGFWHLDGIETLDPSTKVEAMSNRILAKSLGVTRHAETGFSS